MPGRAPTRRSPLLLALSLAACSHAGTPPTVTLSAPPNADALSGTVAIPVDAPGASRVQLFARHPGSLKPGAPLGSASGAPFVAPFDTTRVPNNDPLELYATATGSGGTASSAPVTVVARNPEAPTLGYLAALSLPAQPVQGQTLRPVVPPDHTPRAGVRPPARWQGRQGALLRAQDGAGGSHALEWGWPTVSGASGYRVYRSSGDAAGPWQQVYAQTPGTGGLQKYSTLVSASDGQSDSGVISVLSGPQLQEGPLSNARSAIFLPAQQVASPADGQTVADGRPILTWNALSGSGGSLYFVYDKSPWDPAANVVWTNYPNATGGQSASYPSAQDALPGGTYFWWVAGVRFDPAGNAVAFSYSVPRRFRVP